MSDKIDLTKLRDEARDEAVNVTVDEKPELVSRETEFNITYDAPSGEVIECTLISAVMNGEDRLAKTRLLAKLTTGLRFDTLPSDEQLRLDAISRVLIQVKNLPAGLQDWITQDNELLGTIHNFLVRHETLYFRSSFRQGEDVTRKSRVQLDSTILDSTRSTE